MKKIAALIDFTEGCKIAISLTAVIAEKSGAELLAVYIMADGGDKAEKEAEILKFASQIPGVPTTIQAMAGSGELMKEAAHCLHLADADLVVVGTHGIRGIKQQLFGAHILKLVQSIPLPCIVVQENTKVDPNGFGTILFPVGSAPDYDIKIAQTAAVADIFQSEIIQYEIDKSIGESEMVQRNSRDTRKYFETKQYNFKVVIEEATILSVGYSRQTLKYASENNIGLIAQMSDVPATEAFYGIADKENFLTNEFGIPVLCCNQ